MPAPSSSEVADFARFKLERHVEKAIEKALVLAKGEPLAASHLLLGALLAARTDKSRAFLRLTELLPLGSVSDVGPVDPTAPNLAELPLSAPLARSFSVAEKFIADTGVVWGRDYITLALLADDPSLDEMTRAAGLELGRIRGEWLRFVSDGDERRSPSAWREWWRMAGFAEAEKPSKAESSVAESKPEPFDPASWQLSWGTSQILGAAARSVRSGHNVSTSAVLLAMAEVGRSGTDPQWVADFLRQAFAECPDAYANVASDFRSRWKPVAPTRDARPPAFMMMPGLAWAMRRAQDIAQRTTGSAAIGGRHLLAALLQEPPQPHKLGAHLRLAEIGWDVELLRQRLFEWCGYDDNEAAWRRVLIGAGPLTLLEVQYDADGTTGPDLLGIDRDVVALATLIAARASSPPLSIGLFGDWGSGKTFFMQKLRQAVADLSSDARKAERMQRELPFYKHIVQIEFNAWHYVEGNLWASMVEHILDNLRTSERQPATLTEQLQKHWIDKLGFAEQAKTAAEQKQKDAGDKVVSAEAAVKVAKETHDRKKEEVERLSGASVERAFKLSGALPVIQQSLKPLGLTPLSDAVGDLQSSLREARGVIERGNAILTPLVHAGDRKARWVSLLIILAAAPAAGIGVAWLLAALGQERIAGISAFFASAAGLLTTAAAWVRKQAKWMSERLKGIEEAQRVYDEALKKELADVAAQTAKAQAELQLARQEYLQAQQLAEQARKEQAAAASDLAAATTSKLLGRFIQDRAASNDYRKHLGVLAIVRQDFQQLSQLIEEENYRLSPDGTDDPRFAKLKRIGSKEEEDRDADTRINRIVLYIDDLDRCPPQNVVAVLQAVHLLLAFPLFVVVVGVDARWITRSLETRYRELLHVGDVDAAGDVAEMFGVARSEDYLEKIFQIPMWLRPMELGATRRMVKGLLRIAPAATDSGESSAGVKAPPVTQPPGQENQGGAQPPKVGDPQKTEGADFAVTSAATQTAEASQAEATPATPNLESLKEADFELSAINALSPLLGRSPRALKRFVNLYRLIKAGLTRPEHDAFLRRSGETLSDFAAVLFLLAVDTGLPRVSRAMFDLLLSVKAKGQTEQTQVKDLITELEKADAASTADWATLESWLNAQLEGGGFKPNAVVQLVKWVPRVSRYSFQATHIEAVRDASSRRKQARKP